MMAANIKAFCEGMTFFLLLTFALSLLYVFVAGSYYSIGNNSEKLSRPISWEVMDESYPKVQKGYFSIGDNYKSWQNNS